MRTQASLELGQHQQLVLTPQLRQALNLLQCSTQELDLEIARALTENPLLQRDETPPEAASAQAEMLEHRWAQPTSRTVTDDMPESPAAQSLADHLLQQLHTTRASARDQALVTLLIDDLDEHGRLDFDPAAYTAVLPSSLGVEDEEWQTALRLLQSFDPAGIGARSLSECLRLQLRARAAEWPAAVLATALQLTRHLEDLAAGRWAKLCAALACDRDQLELARQAILRLDPHPASAWTDEAPAYIVPDILFYHAASGWQASLNPALEPRVRVDPDLLAQMEDTTTGPVLRESLQQARLLIAQLGQRRHTILRVAECIAVHQQAFLDHGQAALRPLVLREVAQVLGLHESTISRATRLKYAQTPWGICELKYFFATGVQTDTGEDASAQAIQAVMRRLLAAEQPEKPWSDARLTTLLAEQGFVIARRTVAKYREAMGIPVASLRKKRLSSA
ncbi:RNA polymerase factor sigma-54 [Castellaniella sp.]|uniref:RNA polymerase factor sigma-54 n=1 Tax=Castellaniella sp. TaxID=1955812 RepID=UPI002AFDE579|nr:RNA polymerase factor sigma-54 [Castellaniella sp.]